MPVTNLKKILVLLITAIFISSCSENMVTRKNSNSDDNEVTFTSRIPIPESPNKPGDVAICNSSEMNFLTAKSMVYYDTAMQPRYNAVRIFIPTISTAFEDTRYHINFYKWKANTQGEIHFDSSKLQIRLEKKSNKQNASGYIDSLNWGKIKTELSKDSIDVSNMATIFSSYNLVVLLDNTQESQTATPYAQDPSVDYDVIKIAVYKDSTLQEEKDFLIPAFYAHPATFADGKPKVLIKLHPLYDLMTTSWPGSHFAELLNGHCF
jgi:hypothetical protein